MAGSPESLVLAELRAIRGDIASVRESLGAIKRQLVSVESSQAQVLHLTVQLVERRLHLRDV